MLFGQGPGGKLTFAKGKLPFKKSGIPNPFFALTEIFLLESASC